MSLVSKTSSKLFALLHASSDPEEVAILFVKEYANDPVNSNIQLTDLILRCCKVTRFVQVSQQLIIDEDIDGIVNIVNSAKSHLFGSTLSPAVSELFTKVAKFFNHFWLLNSNDRAEENESFLRKLILALTEVDIRIVQFICIQILSKFVTVVLENKLGNFEPNMRQICKYARKILVHSFFSKDRLLLRSSLSEFELWLQVCPSNFKNDRYLCYIIWSLKDTSSEIVLTGLEILERLLLEDSANLPQRFIQQCVQTIYTLEITATQEIFVRICNCYLQIRQNFENLISSHVEKKLNDQLYSQDKNICETAADYWVAVHYNADCFQYLFNVIASVKSYHPSLKYVEYFVDSLVDKCPVLTQWDLVIKLLVDQYDEQLDDDDKHILFVLTTHVVERVITKKKPKLRDASDDLVDDEIAKNITRAFLPYMKLLFKLEYADPALILKLVTFFHFDSMPVGIKKNVIHSCELAFQNVPDILLRRLVIELLHKMRMYGRDSNIASVCSESILKLKTDFETRVEEIFHDFLRRPAKYHNSNAGRKVKDDFMALQIIDVVCPIEKKIAYNDTLLILRKPGDWISSNPTFMRVRESCIVLGTQYFMRKLLNEDITEEISDNVRGFMTCLAFNIEKPSGNRSEVAIFHSLCELGKLLKSKNLMNLFPENAIKNIDLFFRSALNKPDNEYQQDLMTEYLNMIDFDVMSMECAYNALNVHCCKDDVKYELILHQFLERQSEKRSTNFMAKWLTTFWMQICERIPENRGGSMNQLQKLGDLIYPIRFKLNNILYESHIVGIDYASSSEVQHSDFVRVLSVFSPCLGLTDKKRVIEYVSTKATLNVEDMKMYIRSLKTVDRLTIEIDDKGSSVQESSRTSTLGQVYSEDRSVSSVDTGESSNSQNSGNDNLSNDYSSTSHLNADRSASFGSDESVI